MRVTQRGSDLSAIRRSFRGKIEVLVLMMTLLLLARSGMAQKSEVSIEVDGGYRLIRSNGLPNHEPGQFPNSGNPNTIRAQRYEYRVPTQPQLAASPVAVPPRIFGVALNGIPFDPGTAMFWGGSPESGWHYDALSGRVNLGLDGNNAHVQPNGAYHYHGIPAGLLRLLAKEGQMTLLGYAADGFPIYGPLAHVDPLNPDSELREMRPAYRLREGERPGGREGPGGRYDGTFVQDFHYIAGVGDLDECNGRFGVTPEYPEGTYYYVLTTAYPFVPRFWRGRPDASFDRDPRDDPGRRPPPGMRMGHGRMPGGAPPPLEYGVRPE